MLLRLRARWAVPISGSILYVLHKAPMVILVKRQIRCKQYLTVRTAFWLLAMPRVPRLAFWKIENPHQMRQDR